MSAALDGPDDAAAPRTPSPGPAARRRPDAAARGTATLPELRRLVENQILTGFSHRLWLVGEVADPETTPGGSLHFELVGVEDDEWLRLPCDVPADVLPELRSLLLRVSDADLDDVVAPGRTARVGGLLRYDFPTHRLALTVSAVDPETTAHALAERRARARADVAAAGFARHQGRLEMPVAPVHVALLGGADDPVLARSAERLRASGYAVQVRAVPVVLSGAAAGGRLAEALARVAGHVEVVLVVRSEGRPLELAAFDGPEVARAVAATPVPVLVGLGGAGEATVCDDVAAESLPTADAAVDLVLGHLADAEAGLRRGRDAVRDEAEAAVDRARAALAVAADEVEAAGDDAADRATAAARRRFKALAVVAGVLAVAVVAATVVTGAPLLLVALLLIAAGLWTEHRRTTVSDRKGGRPMSLGETSFAQVLERLDRIRDELRRTSSPETVHDLVDEARQLVARGEHVLGRALDPGARPARPAPAAPGDTADRAGSTRTGSEGGPAAEDGGPDRGPGPDDATRRHAVPSGGETDPGGAVDAPWAGDSDTTQVLPTRPPGSGS